MCLACFTNSRVALIIAWCFTTNLNAPNRDHLGDQGQQSNASTPSRTAANTEIQEEERCGDCHVRYCIFRDMLPEASSGYCTYTSPLFLISDLGTMLR